MENQLIQAAFQEDAPTGDITSKYFGNPQKISRAKIIAKAAGILAGIDLAKDCFKYTDRQISFKKLKPDGSLLRKGEVIAEIKGKTNSILLAERTALNFLQHLSGVATATFGLSKLIKSTHAVLLDTRKTTPGLRKLEKYAVVCGGGQNHRLNLSDMILIKDNHLAELSPGELAERFRRFRRLKPKLKIEMEAATLGQVAEFLRLPVDIIMLDNMSPAQMREAIKLRKRTKKEHIYFEASGNISKKNILAVAKTGVEYISSGSITHSAPALDFSLLLG